MTKPSCYHCGSNCDAVITLQEKAFCCEGCKIVFQLLDENGLCQYYELSKMPGISAKGNYISSKYDYLDNQAIQDQLIQFKSEGQHHVIFYLPQIHCVSCVWLLENLHKINHGIIQSQIQFEKKEVKVIYQPQKINLKEVVQLLAFVGYEPLIHLGGNDWLKKKKVNKKQLYKIGIAGFCFSNIMMLSFPEYFSNDIRELGSLRPFFIYLNLFLSLPVLFFYDSFSFDRDYTSFFPLGVSVLQEGQEIKKPLSELQKKEIVIIRTGEMVPADAILLTNGAYIDYSFVTGENAPLEIFKGNTVYAGGIQKGRLIQLEVIKPVGQSYITELWNNPLLNNIKNTDKSFVHPWSRYFTLILFAIAISSGVYWYFVNPHQILSVVTAILIVACPCSLLLTVTFTYGNVLRWLGKTKMYCKNASVIEVMDTIDNIVFDKTGTLTNHDCSKLEYFGKALSDFEMMSIKSITNESLHPLSQFITQYLNQQKKGVTTVEYIENKIGLGTFAKVGDLKVLMGSRKLLQQYQILLNEAPESSGVYIAINGVYKGMFKMNHQYRKGIGEMIQALREKGYQIHMLSGDHSNEKENLQKILGTDVPLLFEQSPEDKLNYIQLLQSQGKKVMMVGDGLNDAGALQKSDVGIAVTDQTHLFTPASDVILEGDQVSHLNQLLLFAKKAKRIIVSIFILSIMYNIIGMFFATRAQLSPMVAAILMPISSISIVALSALLSYIFSRSLPLKHD
ncbi:MAG: HAD family hydrolase [Chitinophagia bacterium]|nr:HAD family hydrolase [Chitinophagia bacterium]